jgi:hypothetical protein
MLDQAPALLLVALVIWVLVGTWLLRSGDAAKKELLQSLHGKRVTICYSWGRGVVRTTGIVGAVERGRVRLSNGVENTIVAVSAIREIEADGVRLRRR